MSKLIVLALSFIIIGNAYAESPKIAATAKHMTEATYPLETVDFIKCDPSGSAFTCKIWSVEPSGRLHYRKAGCWITAVHHGEVTCDWEDRE